MWDEKHGPVVQLVRTLACHARGRGFESHPDRHFYQGCSPSAFICADLAHLVERDLAKVEVAGSSPVIRSNPFIIRVEHFAVRCGAIAKR